MEHNSRGVKFSFTLSSMRWNWTVATASSIILTSECKIRNTIRRWCQRVYIERSYFLWSVVNPVQINIEKGNISKCSNYFLNAAVRIFILRVTKANCRSLTSGKIWVKNELFGLQISWSTVGDQPLHLVRRLVQRKASWGPTWWRDCQMHT